MKWLVDNWTFVVFIVALAGVALWHIRKLSGLPSEQQQVKIKSWLLAIVIEAERQFGSKTGRIKLSFAYSKFIEAFPSLAPVIPFELFASFVDEVLEEMREILENNEKAREYVYGNK